MEREQTLSLKDFIKTTLLEINEAVVDSLKEGLPLAFRRSDGLPICKTVEFDIAVQITQNDTTGKTRDTGLGISVVNLNFGKEHEKSSEQLRTNRIKFSVDLFLGLDKAEINDE
ncbi:MAG: hypothetical protein LBC62_10575 [Treponema sp.]|jgi:hypothetical protein|nr:hypothetical protein [Treponema sp.]